MSFLPIIFQLMACGDDQNARQFLDETLSDEGKAVMDEISESQDQDWEYQPNSGGIIELYTGEQADFRSCAWVDTDIETSLSMPDGNDEFVDVNQLYICRHEKAKKSHTGFFQFDYQDETTCQFEMSFDHKKFPGKFYTTFPYYLCETQAPVPDGQEQIFVVSMYNFLSEDMIDQHAEEIASSVCGDCAVDYNGL